MEKGKHDDNQDNRTMQLGNKQLKQSLMKAELFLSTSPITS